MKKRNLLLTFIMALFCISSCSNKNNNNTNNDDNKNIKYVLTSYSNPSGNFEASEMYEYYYLIFYSNSKEMEITYKNNGESNEIKKYGVYEKLEHSYFCKVDGIELTYQITSETTLSTSYMFIEMNFKLEN